MQSKFGHCHRVHRHDSFGCIHDYFYREFHEGVFGSGSGSGGYEWKLIRRSIRNSSQGSRFCVCKPIVVSKVKVGSLILESMLLLLHLLLVNPFPLCLLVFKIIVLRHHGSQIVHRWISYAVCGHRRQRCPNKPNHHSSSHVVVQASS